MTWVESRLGGFRARHDDSDARDAKRVLESLSFAAARMEGLFARPVDEITVVLHGSVISLTMTNPLMPLTWLMTDPAARRYVGGWAGATELHVLSPALLRTRASNVSGSREMLALSAASLYARRVIIDNNRDLHVIGAVRVRRELRWAWMLEGAARWFAGQTEHARPAIARRLHEGSQPRFPPGLRDATLLGGTVIDLLVREEGEISAAAFATRLDPRGPTAALADAFGGRPIRQSEEAWRSHLTRLAGP
ncbi:MAG TPA: hypothetical protein VIH49_06925 [Solirubrobacteraceae bacterium]|jgi:hypothetical protein|nr:hypothetical protein [Solirubrobacteraceae bacterium]